MFGKDTFKMYLRFGSKVKLPDILKLSDFRYETQSLLGGSRIDINIGENNNNGNNNNNNKKKKKKFSIITPKLGSLSFALNRDKKVSL